MAQTANWRIDLMKAHPRLFKIITDSPERSFGYPRCESGWRDVLVRLCTRIENALQYNETFRFIRIGEKWGVALFRWDGQVSDETRLRINEAINLADERAACTCEICGAEGYSQAWALPPRCVEHAARLPMPVRVEKIRILRRPGRPEMYHARYDRETDTMTEVSPPSPPPEE